MNKLEINWHYQIINVQFFYSLGVNSGVMLMNLTRMRSVGWVDKMMGYYDIYRYNITWGDQDLINIFFHYFPGNSIILEC